MLSCSSGMRHNVQSVDIKEVGRVSCDSTH